MIVGADVGHREAGVERARIVVLPFRHPKLEVDGTREFFGHSVRKSPHCFIARVFSHSERLDITKMLRKCLDCH